MDTEVEDTTINVFVQRILQSFLLGSVGDLPLASVILPAGDIEKQRWHTRQESNDNPPDVMPRIIEQVTLERLHSAIICCTVWMFYVKN